MTNEPSSRQVPPGTAAAVGVGAACPSSETLSAYLDGQLDALAQSPIEDHISRCEECYFVVRETAATWAETGAAESSPRDVDAPRAPKKVRRPKSLLRGYVLPIAATVMVGVGALALWRQGHSSGAYVDAVRPLVEAVGERRFFEPRLTGGFKYGPTISFKRSTASGPDSGTWEMLAAAGELRDRTDPSSPGARGSRAAAALFLGEVDVAVAVYSLLLKDDPGTAEWPSNLAAALLVRARGDGETPDQRDVEAALRQAEAALRLDPRLPEAQFNRGLALKALGRVAEAAQAFVEIEKQGGSWREAASDQLRDIAEAPPRRP